MTRCGLQAPGAVFKYGEDVPTRQQQSHVPKILTRLFVDGNNTVLHAIPHPLKLVFLTQPKRAQNEREHDESRLP